MNLARMPLALAAAVLLIAGAYRVSGSDLHPEGVALLAAGLICLGSWLGAEAASAVISRRDNDEQR